MAWDDWDDGFIASKSIVQEEDVQISYLRGDNNVEWTQTVTTLVKTIGGLTLQGASDGAEKIRESDTATTSFRRQNDANAYIITWSERTDTGWVEVV